MDNKYGHSSAAGSFQKSSIKSSLTASSTSNGGSFAGAPAVPPSPAVSGGMPRTNSIVTNIFAKLKNPILVKGTFAWRGRSSRTDRRVLFLCSCVRSFLPLFACPRSIKRHQSSASIEQHSFKSRQNRCVCQLCVCSDNYVILSLNKDMSHHVCILYMSVCRGHRMCGCLFGTQERLLHV